MEKVSDIGVMALLEELRGDAKLAKSRHFAAADRKLLWHRIFGIPVIVINLLLSVVIAKFRPLSGEIDWISLVAIMFTFTAAALSSVQTFFNFQKSAEGHRSIANRYLWVQRLCKAAIARQSDYPDNIDVQWKKYDEYLNAYQQSNIDAEAFPTSKGDLQKALMRSDVTPAVKM